MSLWPLKIERSGAAGLSHSLGHKLGARYGIPHGMTSCLTLAPVVALQASIATSEHKRALAKALFYLQIPSSGAVESDVQVLAHAIEHLVIELGLRTDLGQCGVPKNDVPQIVEQALGSKDDERFGKVVKILENLYSD